MKRIAVDLAKSVYQVAESVRSGQVVQRKRLNRKAFRRYIQEQAEPQCHQPKLQPCPRQAPRSSQPPWPSGDDQASAAQSGGLTGLAVM